MNDPTLSSRLRPWAPRRVLCVPDHGDEVTFALVRLEVLLMAVVGAEEDAKAVDSSWALPSALAGGGALASVRTIGAALGVAKADPARPLGNDGRERLVPLMVLEVATEDLHAVGLTGRALGRALLPGGHSTVAEALGDMAGGHLDSSLIGDRPTPADLVAEAARLHGLLDLPPDDHVARLAAALPGGTGAVVLSPQLEEDYELLVGRFLAVWHVGDRLAVFLYPWPPVTALLAR